MSDYLWMCQRCGCVGFHSEACITATAAEAVARRDDYLRESVSTRERSCIEEKAVEAERRRIVAAVVVEHQAIRDLLGAGPDEHVGIPLAAVLRIVRAETHPSPTGGRP